MIQAIVSIAALLLIQASDGSLEPPNEERIRHYNLMWMGCAGVKADELSLKVKESAGILAEAIVGMCDNRERDMREELLKSLTQESAKKIIEERRAYITRMTLARIIENRTK